MPADRGPVSSMEPGAIEFIPLPETGFTVEEIYRLFSAAGQDGNPLNELTAAADVHDGAMIALVPAADDLERLEVPGGEPVDQLHLTLFYLGDAVDVLPHTRIAIIDALQELAGRQEGVRAQAFAIAAFNPMGDEPCLVVLLGGDDLADLRDSVEAELLVTDVNLDLQHRPWIPHITLRYFDEEPEGIDLGPEAEQRLGPVTFDRIRVAFGGDVTDVPLGDFDSLAAAVQAFHLPGKHDQRSHGRGGVGAHSSPEEARIAQKLNKGKKLDPSVESEARMITAIDQWTTGGGGVATSFADGVDHAIIHNPEADTLGGQFARTVAAAPPDAPTLYRGMRGQSARSVPQSGDTFDVGATSFSSSSKVADSFATMAAQDGDVIVVQRVKKGSRALSIEQHANSTYKSEKEHVALGRYRVTKRTDSQVTVKGLNGKSVTVTRVDLETEMIDDVDGPPTFTRYDPFAGIGE